MTRLVVVAALLVGAMPGLAEAQALDRQWGVVAALSPRWSSPESLQSFLVDGDGSIAGSEVSVGIARGMGRGARWSLSFVRKPFEDGSGVTERREQCLTGVKCFSTDLSTLTDHASLNGVRLEVVVPVTTLGRRARLGVVLG